MVAVNPYRRWRRAIHVAGVAMVCLLTAAVLGTLLLVVIQVFTNGRTV
ncbi:hypothetical protein [Actinoplanes sp. L3-i22]|nr:hypothetical protein [Actinoplanes sp. L3-i22]BCY15488.1 hypothetical protein L3i22_105760 [Actinoplanes sp. L3-i22]